MRWILKEKSPNAFEEWKESTSPKKWSDLKGSRSRDKDLKISDYSKDELRAALLKEQHGKCLYCERGISNKPLKTKIDHVRIPRKKAAIKYVFDYNNLGLSCDGGERSSLKPRVLFCDAHKADKTLPFTPYHKECEEKLIFNFRGEVNGKGTRAKNVIEILNLNCTFLKNRRRDAIEGYVANFDGSYISPPEARKLYEQIVSNKKKIYSKAILDSLRKLFEP